MSESCENCGAYKLGFAIENGDKFVCEKMDHWFLKRDLGYLAKICKHYPVPKPPEPGMFEKAYSKHFYAGSHAQDTSRYGFRCGYLAAVEQVDQYYVDNTHRFNLRMFKEYLDQMAESAKERT